MIPTLIAISIVIFTIINLPPGNYFTTYIAELQSSGEAADLAKIHFLKAEYGFDRPLWEQYLYWAGGLLHGDLGYSFAYDLPVNKVVGDRLFLTFHRLLHDDLLHLYRRLPDRRLFGDSSVQLDGPLFDLARVSRVGDAELSCWLSSCSTWPMCISAFRSAG